MNEEINQISKTSSSDILNNKIELPKLLIDYNYDKLKKLSFQKLTDLTLSSKSSNDLNKSKSLNNLTLTIDNDKKPIIDDNLIIIDNLKKENEELNSKLRLLEQQQKEKDEKVSKEIDELKLTNQQQLDKIIKQLDLKTKELERIVVKYAVSEKQILDAQKLKDDFEKKLKDALKDKDSLLVRIKGLSNEKQSLINALDNKVNEINNGQKDIDKIKKLLKEKDAQLMQFEFKLNKEQENQNETAKKLEISLKQIEELNCELSKYRDTNGDDLTSINKHELESKCNELIDLKTKNSELNDQIQLKDKRIKQLEQDNNKFEEDKRNLTNAINLLKQEFIICEEKIESNRRLKIDYDELNDQLEQLTKELNELRQENDELITESKAYRQKEGELLEFTDRLQTKTVQLQSEHNYYKQKCTDLEGKFNELDQLINKQKDEIINYEAQLKTTNEKHEKELELLVKRLAEETNLKEKLKIKKEELENENKIMKKKNIQSIKELNKELISLRKKLDQQNDNQTDNNQLTNETISLNSSRTNSLNSLERNSNGILNDNSSLVLNSSNTGNLIRSPSFNSNNSSNCGNQILQPTLFNQQQFTTNQNFELAQIDKNVLLNKILNLQQQLSKLRSRIDFLEEHNSSLLDDIKKKTKLIQNFILREESGCLSSQDMDTFKKKTLKNQISKKGSGLMASLYKNTVNDSNMTLDLSLQINSKLQAVLEDTILKNITLKENVDTLGAEIERMSAKKN